MTAIQTDFQAPGTLEEALQLIQKQGYQLLTQGPSALRSTDVKKHQHLLVSLRNVVGLAEVRTDADALRMGACASFDQLQQSPLVQPYPVLLQALQATSEPHLRHACTLGGALHDGGANYGPVLAALMALDAQAEFLSAAGTSRVAIDSLSPTGMRPPVAAGTLLDHVSLAAGGPGAGAYVALDPVTGSRHHQGIALSLSLSGQQVQDVRLVLAGFTAFPVRLRAVEAALMGVPLGAEQIAKAAQWVDPSVLPQTASSVAYPLHLVQVLVRRVLAPFAAAMATA